jgi:hypothetical protein
MKISRCFTYKTFNPNINDFDKESKSFAKEVDTKTAKAIKRNEVLQHICLYLWFPLFVAIITFACMADEYWDWRFAVCAVAGFVAIVWVSINIVNRETKDDALREQFCETNFDDEKQECETYNAKQIVIAEKWRAEHPFEEKIRMAKTRGSSVDIAEMIKHYEEYIKK